MGNEKFSCPHCGLLYNFRYDWAGQKAKCKCCKNTFTVPDRPTTVRSPKSTDASVAKQTSRSPSSNPKPKPASADDSVPEATIFMGDTPAAPVAETAPTPAGSAEILDAEPAGFLDPIDEPVAQVVPETPGIVPGTPAAGIPIASSAPDPFATTAVPINDPLATYAAPGPGASADGAVLQRPKKAKASAGPSATQGILAHLKTRPLACALILATLAVFLAALFTSNFFRASIEQKIVALVVVCVIGAIHSFVVYLGLRHDRGKAWDKVLTIITMIFAIGIGLLIVGGHLLAILAIMMKLRPPAPLLARMLAELTGILILVVVVILVYYFLMRKLGFYRVNASILILFCVISLGSTIFSSQNTRHNAVAKNETEKADDSPRSKPSKTTNPDDEHSSQPSTLKPAKTNPFSNSGSDTTGNNPFETAATNTNTKNPFETTGSGSNNSSPFETAGSGSGSGNPFQTTKSETGTPNPFETTESGSNHSNPFGANPNPAPDTPNPFGNTGTTPRVSNPFGTRSSIPTPNVPHGWPGSLGSRRPNVRPYIPLPAENTPSVTGLSTVSLDDLIKRLNRASTSNVTKVVKVLALQTPVDEKRETVCRIMIRLLQNDRYSFAEKEIADVLVKWMTPKVSDEVVKILNQSTGPKHRKRIKQLAQIPDDKVAAAVVQLWEKNPFVLRDAIPSLGARAEKPLWDVLDDSDSDAQVKVKACRFLARQGTSKSIPKLNRLTNDDDSSVAKAAEKAIETLSK